jgi:HPr kinase/phosphorylase
MGYLNTLKETLSIERFTSLLEFNPPCIILSVNVILPNYLFELTKNYNVPILKSKLRTTPFYSLLYGYLHQRLTPRIKVKGTSLDIYGVGVLLIGEENIGKSETALELINRGHLLINDDYVQLYEEYPSSIFAESFNQDIILNGIGRFDVKQHYGTKSFKETTKIDLVINFLSVVPQSNKKGLNISSYNILNSVIPEIIFPVKKSQNMITLIESAVVYYKSSNIRPTAKSK